MSRQTQRKTYLIDKSVQTTLLYKAAWYWILSLAVVAALNVMGWIFVSPGVHKLVEIREQLPSIFATFFMALISSLIVLPFLLADLAKHTNRFAGPVFRLQRAMKDLANGKSVAPLEFRDGDYWTELAESFNQVATRLEDSERQFADSALEFDTLAAK